MSLPLQPIPLETLRHAEARWLHGYWQSKIAEAALPPSEAMSFGEMREIESDLLTLEPTAAAGELRYRLVGTAITARFGIELKGKTLRFDSSGAWATAFHEAITTRRPVALRGQVSGDTSGRASFEAVVLPLAGPVDGGISVLAGMFFFDD